MFHTVLVGTVEGAIFDFARLAIEFCSASVIVFFFMLEDMEMLEHLRLH